ncbi:MAG: hypothetical protein A3I02_09450 [Betaproteobacteria bacterium RIFCSPLOWO2_02_FULL_67_26]|nr:MAG: hypothetical protein A3I02_09450 [Betaproteobacteria bacterium RIFCSPLOWO2_02_FULL_67_26]
MRFPCAPLALACALVASGCAQFSPYIPTSEGHIGAPPAKPEPQSAIPPPARTSEFLPPPKPAAKQQTYSVVVNEVPVKDLLLALARDTKQNIDVHPGLAGLVSLNAINETLPAILERVSKQVNMRYRLEGNTLIVSPDLPYVKTYRVNYVNMTRDTTSSVGVTGELGSSGGSSSGSTTTVTTTSNNDFWKQLGENIRSLLNSTRLQSLTAEAKAERQARDKQDQDLRLKQLEAVSRAGQGAPGSPQSPLSPGLVASVVSAPQQQDDVVVNGISGTVTINATEKQHQLVQQHIDSIVNAMQRQVLIEATIVEVQLSNNYQGGIDWGRVSQSGGIAFTQAMLGGNLAVAPFFALFYNQNNQRPQDIQLTVRLLQEFGNARVLSSPKMMTLNNQTALLKVVDNIVYFDVKTTPAVVGAGGSIVPATTTTAAKTVAVGVVMAVTPQINEDGRVSLTVRPTITRLQPNAPFVNDPNPDLANAGQVNRVPQIQTREMESVLQIGSGQTVILGGLMQDDSRRNRDQLPIIGSDPRIGDLFAFRDEQVSKTELVIFLRPTVVANPTLDSDELKFFQRFLPKPEAPPPPPEQTGAAR